MRGLAGDIIFSANRNGAGRPARGLAFPRCIPGDGIDWMGMPGSTRMSRVFQRPLEKLVQLVFEPVCHGCERLLAPGSLAGEDPTRGCFWCSDCLADLYSRPEFTCSRCSAELPSVRPLEGCCRLCRTMDWRFERVLAVGNYHRGMSELIVKMKGLRDESLAWQLGLLLGSRVREACPPQMPDLVVPVPAWWIRRLRRGFVAAEIIAAAVARECRLPLAASALRCCKKTGKQGTLSIPARFRNVSGMFEIRRSGAIRGKRILLVDDVLTSGATASQAASVLRRQGGAAAVDVAVVARGARGN